MLVLNYKCEINVNHRGHFRWYCYRKANFKLFTYIN